jgi:hypothetical protein
VLDSKSHGSCEAPEQQLREDRICSGVLWCLGIGSLRQQHFMPQSELAIAPLARILAPKQSARARQMALIKNLFSEAPFFIVK